MNQSFFLRVMRRLTGRPEGGRLVRIVLCGALVWEFVARPLVRSIWPEISLPSIGEEILGLLGLAGI